MKKQFLRLAQLSGVAALSLSPFLSASVAISLPAVFSDHAVLQAAAQTSIWGKADPGEKIEISLGTTKASALTGEDGRWQTKLDLSKTGPGPFDLSVSGKSQIVIHDVAVGQVWLASGQSNMEFVLKNKGVPGGPEEIAHSADSGLRQFLVKKNAASQPQEDCDGQWTVADPATSGDFTAVGYFFGKSLRKHLNEPVGIINSSWGGTIAEAWTSQEALNTVPALKAGGEHIEKKAADFLAAQQRYLASLQDWEIKYHRPVDFSASATPADAAPGVSTTDWKSVTLPGRLRDAGLPDAGVVWLRANMPVSPKEMGKDIRIDLGSPGGFETVYWNGQLVGGFSPEKPAGHQHRFFIHADQLKEGDNLLAIRLAAPQGGLAMGGKMERFVPDLMTSTSLAGPWLAKAETSFTDDPEATRTFPHSPPSPTPPQHSAALLYNGMIHPLLPFTIRGAIWYQGESNASRAFQYQTSFPLMIGDWRRRWGHDFPFYFCQLANYQPKTNQPEESAWAELREAQSLALSLPNTGEAVLIDVGEEADIHPKNKQVVGYRLASIALAQTYGQTQECSGPVYDKMTVEGDKVRVSFQHTASGLSAHSLPTDYQPSTLRPERKLLALNSPDSELQGFTICGSDQKWVWAAAHIEGQTVIVSSPLVLHPVAVRYAWANNPTCNLCNGAKLPASPFRTDHFPLSTEKATW